MIKKCFKVKIVKRKKKNSPNYMTSHLLWCQGIRLAKAGKCKVVVFLLFFFFFNLAVKFYCLFWLTAGHLKCTTKTNHKRRQTSDFQKRKEQTLAKKHKYNEEHKAPSKTKLKNKKKIEREKLHFHSVPQLNLAKNIKIK